MVSSRLRRLGFGDLVGEHRRSRPGALAVVDGDRRCTWADLDDRVTRLAGALGRAGVASGDRVLWIGQNSSRVLELLVACARLGALFCPANWRQSPDELAFVLEDLEPAVVVWQESEIGERVSAARSGSGGGARWIQHDAPASDPASYEALLASHEAEVYEGEVDPDEPLLAMYTAAFEGRPNAALLSQTALLTQDHVIGRMLRVDDAAVFLNSGPLFHIATLMVTTATCHFGGTNVFTPRVDAEEVCRLIAQERVTHAFLARPALEEVRTVNAEGGFDLSSLWEGGQPDERRVGLITPGDSPWALRPGGFGQTEVMGLATFSGLGAAAEGAAGRPSPAAVVRIIDHDGEEVPAGEVGELVVRGPVVASGYFRRPELSEWRARGGWHHTGDLGRRETDGSITFIGPMLDMIKSASENIYPAEVEAALASHPAVAAACVIGVADPEWSQRVKAVVVAREDAEPEAEDLIDHCRERIASYKKPRKVVFVDELPRTAAGTVDRRAVDEAHGGGGYPGAG